MELLYQVEDQGVSIYIPSTLHNKDNLGNTCTRIFSCKNGVASRSGLLTRVKLDHTGCHGNRVRIERSVLCI